MQSHVKIGLISVANLASAYNWSSLWSNFHNDEMCYWYYHVMLYTIVSARNSSFPWCITQKNRRRCRKHRKCNYNIFLKDPRKTEKTFLRNIMPFESSFIYFYMIKKCCVYTISRVSLEKSQQKYLVETNRSNFFTSKIFGTCSLTWFCFHFA